MALHRVAALVLLTLAVSSAFAQENKPPATIPSPLVLRIESGKLTGEGGEILTKAIQGSQFVAVGEDHGFNEIPQFMAAVWDANRFDHLAIEVGPITTPQLETILRQPAPDRQLLAFEQTYPASVPFYNWKPDFDLLKHVIASRPQARQVLIGLDQEFIMAPGFLLTRILELKPSPVVKTQAEAMLKANSAALADVQKTGNMGAVYTFAAPQSEFDKLADAAKQERSAEVRRIIDQLLETRQVYALYNQNRGYDSNRDRAKLMKRNLVAALGPNAPSHPPRLMLKFGGNHLFRGLNTLNSSEIGNYIAEWAEGQGLQSTHILVLGKVGTQAGFAGLNDQAHSNDYDWKKDKQIGFATKFYEASRDDQWSVFDLRPLRSKVKQYDPDTQKLILGYDFFVVVPKTTAATNVQ